MEQSRLEDDGGADRVVDSILDGGTGCSTPSSGPPRPEGVGDRGSQMVPEHSAEEDDEDVADSMTSSMMVNPTRDALQEGLMGLIRPTVESIDTQVSKTRQAQEELRSQIESLAQELEIMSQTSYAKEEMELEAAINKLNNAKKRVVVVANILQGAQDRLNKVHRQCLRETEKHRTLLEPGPALTSASTSHAS